MCRTFGLRKYARVPGGGVSRRSSRYDFSNAAPSTVQNPNASTGGFATTTFNSSVSTARFMPTAGSNGNFRSNFSGNGTNSVKCVAIVTTSDNNSNSSSNNAVVIVAPSKDLTSGRGEMSLENKATSTATTNSVVVVPSSHPSKENKTNNGRLVKDNSSDDNSDQIVTTCLIENFAEKPNAIFV